MARAPAQVLLAIFLAFLATHAALSADLVDAPAPDFALRGVDGKTLRLSEFRSEVVLLSFSSDRCARCRQSLAYFEELYREHQSAGLNVIDVDVNGNAKEAANIATELGLSFPILLDTLQSVSRQYDPRQLPVTFLIDREGTVRFVNKGFRGDSGAELNAAVIRLLAD
jgi:peroxiredoxin